MLQVASQMSEDKARQGGSLGWKTRQDVVGAFADTAFKLGVSTACDAAMYLAKRWCRLPAFAKMMLTTCTAMQVGEMTQAPVKTQFGCGRAEFACCLIQLITKPSDENTSTSLHLFLRRYHLILCEGRK